MFLYAWKYIPKQLLRLFPQESRIVESYSRSSVAWTLSILLKGLKVAYIRTRGGTHYTLHNTLLYFISLTWRWLLKWRWKERKLILIFHILFHKLYTEIKESICSSIVKSCQKSRYIVVWQEKSLPIAHVLYSSQEWAQSRTEAMTK